MYSPLKKNIRIFYVSEEDISFKSGGETSLLNTFDEVIILDLLVSGSAIIRYDNCGNTVCYDNRIKQIIVQV